jgi:hypothetical protein
MGTSFFVISALFMIWLGGMEKAYMHGIALGSSAFLVSGKVPLQPADIYCCNNTLDFFLTGLHCYVTWQE